jgi:cytochrome c oxidase cbb3-type subunit II
MSNHEQKVGNKHEKVETNSFLMIVLILITVAFGGNCATVLSKINHGAN